MTRYFFHARIFLFSILTAFLCADSLLTAADGRQKVAVMDFETEEETLPQPIRQPRKTQLPELKNPQAAGNWALGGLYPGVSLKYVTGGKSAWELRAQSGSGVLALGSRYYQYFTRSSTPRLFFGIEADYITFKGKVCKSTGFAGGVFVGGEIFLTRHIGLLMDFSPMYISLSDNNFSESASNLEYVSNMGIYWHFK